MPSKQGDDKTTGADKQPESTVPSEAAIMDALIVQHMERRDSLLQREINQLRSLVEQVAGANALQCVIENGIAEVVDKLSGLTGRTAELGPEQIEILNRIERELRRPPDTDLFMVATQGRPTY
ncbi:hypothetical protein [Rhizobium grahamii]|uniref:Uncharacterized protein n=1 Tax=Rhizobium grahamii TaxID=1120045 RepID=A0A370KGF8_9HYPH|nr:hypothetical protein [Rhizobium grahamii]RDJ03878.1 hypothetical protein B5K06_28610 [Rhizobium grahamii]